MYDQRLMVKYLYHLHRMLLDSDITAASTNGNNTTSSYYNGDNNFDSNMVIILVVLLCALICALGLNSIARCALRCTRRLADGAADGVAPPLASTGLDKKALRQIPVAVYSSEMQIPATDCSICLGELTQGEKVRILPRCNHGFHVRCIDKWLVLHSSCPVCRQPLVDPMSVGAEHVTIEIR